MTSLPSMIAVSEEMLFSRCWDMERPPEPYRQPRQEAMQRRPPRETKAIAPRPRCSGGIRRRIEQCPRASSYPVGQWLTPSHHNEPFIQASSSGQRCSQSWLKWKPTSAEVIRGLRQGSEDLPARLACQFFIRPAEEMALRPKTEVTPAGQ
jgi:hypothetical protein